MNDTVLMHQDTLTALTSGLVVESGKELLGSLHGIRVITSTMVPLQDKDCNPWMRPIPDSTFKPVTVPFGGVNQTWKDQP